MLASLPECSSQGERLGASIVRFARQHAPAAAHQTAAGAAAGARCIRPAGTRPRAAATPTTLTHAAQQALATRMQTMLVQQAICFRVVESEVLSLNKVMLSLSIQCGDWAHRLNLPQSPACPQPPGGLQAPPGIAVAAAVRLGGPAHSSHPDCPAVAARRVPPLLGAATRAMRQLAGTHRTGKTRAVHCVHKANQE